MDNENLKRLSFTSSCSIYNSTYIESLRKQLRDTVIRLKKVEDDCLKLVVALNFVSERCRTSHRNINLKMFNGGIILVSNGVNIQLSISDENLFNNQCYICLSEKKCITLDCNHFLCPECLIQGEGSESMNNCGICRTELKRKCI